MQTVSVPKTRHLNALQALRGVAVIMVLVFHMAGIQRQHIAADATAELEVLSGIWDRGFAGVDLFFVISGFVMVYVTRNIGHGPKDVGRFLYARTTRIYPIWWIFAALTALYFWVTYGQPADPIRIAGEGELIPYLTKSFLLLPQKHLPVLGVGWTLIHEMYFYIIFAGLLFLPKRVLPYALMFWAVCIGLAFSAGWARTMVSSIPSLMGSLLSLEFIMGGLAAWLITRGTLKYVKICALLGVVLLGLGFVFYTRTDAVLTLWGRVPVFAIPCALLVYGLVGMEIGGNLKLPNWLVSIGDWSYSLYLSHVLVLSGITVILTKLYPYLPDFVEARFKIGAPGMLDNIVQAGIGFAGCVIFAGLAYRFIERPLLRLSRKMLKR